MFNTIVMQYESIYDKYIRLFLCTVRNIITYILTLIDNVS